MALPLFKPQTRDLNAPGVVSVMVLPDVAGVQPPCPRADRTLLESVYAYLNPRSPATAEMYVIGRNMSAWASALPWRSLAASACSKWEIRSNRRCATICGRSRPFGPAGQGWPLGRTIRTLELEVAVSKVAGVVEVNELLLFTPLASGAYQPVPADASNQARTHLTSWQLPELLQVLVTTGADGSGISAPP